MSHEEALRVHGLCRHLKKLDVLEEILQASLERSKDKFSANDNKDEFTDYMEAPDIICELPSLSPPPCPLSLISSIVYPLSSLVSSLVSSIVSVLSSRMFLCCWMI